MLVYRQVCERVREVGVSLLSLRGCVKVWISMGFEMCRLVRREPASMQTLSKVSLQVPIQCTQITEFELLNTDPLLD